MKMDILRARDINTMIQELSRDIKHETNSKEKARLVEDQAALKRTLRLIPPKRAEVSYVE